MEEIKQWAQQVHNKTYNGKNIETGPQFVERDTTIETINNLTTLKTLCHTYLGIHDDELVNINNFIKIFEKYTETQSPANNADLKTAHRIMKKMLGRIIENF